MEHIIERIYRFLLEYIDEKGTLLYLDKIDEMISEDQRSLYVDLQHLESFDPVVVDEIISSPKDGLTSASDALKQVLLGKEPDYLTRMQNRLHLRFINPPDRIKKSLRKIRSAALGTLLYTEAIITKSTEVKPYLEVAAFRCVRCQALQPSIRFTEGEYNPPFACINVSNHDDPCTSKTFNLIKDQSTFIDFQRVTLQEKPEELPSGQMPESLTMFMRDDLCDLIRPGDRVKVVGIMESRTDAVLTRGKMPLFLKYIEGVSITKETEEFTDIEISEEDEQAIKNLAQDPNIHRMIRNSIAPVIFGALEEKEAISYLLFGGTSKKASDGTKIRGESNILLIGDPGMGKCVHPDTTLLLANGDYIKIGEYVDKKITYQNQINDGFFDFVDTELISIDLDGNLKPFVSNIIWKRKSPEFLYKITTHNRKSISVTDTHPFYTRKNGIFSTIKAKDLTKEDIIAVPKEKNLSKRKLQNNFDIHQTTNLKFEYIDSDFNANGLQLLTKARYIGETDNAFVNEINQLDSLDNSDINWERVERIDFIPSDTTWVYDLQVPEVHNFIANNIIVHNSQILKSVADLVPRGLYTSGRGSSAAGLTASVIRDPDTGEMTLEAGAVVLADKGIAFIDEFDKMRKEDRSALHESMEQHSVSIAKAGIVATLNARTSILAAANPKLGRWDTKKDAIDNLNLPSTIISRFDLIFPIIDKPNRSEDELKASHILKIHQQIESLEATEESLNKLLLRKYIAYARKNVHPFLTNEAREEIMKFYLDLREGKGLESAVTEYNTDEGLAQQAQKPRTIAITPRQLESLIRLSEARAKIALRDEVSREDAVRVIELFKQSLNRVTKGDIDTLYGMSSQKRNKRETILTIITNLSHSDATPDMDDIMRKGREEGLEDSDIRDMIDQLLQNGEIYEPRPGTFKKMSD